MANKPRIQYVGQFYVYGSEAQKLEEEKQRQARTRLPLPRLEKLDTIYLDPVALVGIAVAIFMLAAMAVGLLQLRDDWAAYERMSTYLSELNKENAEVAQAYRNSYDLEDIQKKAVGLGMVTKDEVTTITFTLTLPEVQEEDELSWWQEWIEFWQGLFAEDTGGVVAVSDSGG